MALPKLPRGLVVGPDGLVTTAPPARRYPWKGMAVNPDAPEPDPPGPWLTPERCLVCGALYRDHRGGYGFQSAAHRLRQAAKGAGDQGGGYRSRRAVLWWLHVMKVEDWHLEHWPCGGGWDRDAGEPYPLEDPLAELGRLPQVLEVAGPWVYVRGHYDDQEDLAPYVLRAVQLHLVHLAAELPGRLELGSALYGRWGFARGGGRTLHLAQEPGRGAFPVTEVTRYDDHPALEATEHGDPPW